MGEVVGLKLDIVAGGALHPFEDVEASKACKAGDLAFRYYFVVDIISFIPMTRSMRGWKARLCAI
jgi:hypothetical protein